MRPERGGNRAAGENLAVLGAVRQLQALAGARENHRVVAHNAAAPKRREADGAVGPLARMPVAGF